MVKIIGLIIGGLILASGIYYLSKEKDDSESKKFIQFSVLLEFLLLLYVLYSSRELL